MAYPWNAGDTLNAADLNNYAGLVFIKSVAIGSGVSSVSVTDAFSSTFANYRIVISTWTSANAQVTMELSGATGSSNYDSKVQYFSTTATGGWSFITRVGNPAWYLGYSASAVATPQNGIVVDLFGPNTNGRHRFASTFASYLAGMAGGQTASTGGNASTGFTIATSTGTLSGGTIQVFGYNDG